MTTGPEGHPSRGGPYGLNPPVQKAPHGGRAGCVHVQWGSKTPLLEERPTGAGQETVRAVRKGQESASGSGASHGGSLSHVLRWTGRVLASRSAAVGGADNVEGPPHHGVPYGNDWNGSRGS